MPREAPCARRVANAMHVGTTYHQIRPRDEKGCTYGVINGIFNAESRYSDGLRKSLFPEPTWSQYFP